MKKKKKKITKEDLMKLEMTALRKEMVDSGYYNRANTRYFKDKKKYDRKREKNKQRQDERE